jgi:hypothetical protein
MVYVLIVVGAVLLVLALSAMVSLSRRRRTAAHDDRRRKAMSLFADERRELSTRFRDAAEATGKPRGLRWKAVELDGAPLFAMDAAGNLYALTGATISFEAIEGGGMEEVEAVGNLRSATAVFVHRDGAWTTDGRVIFNLEPSEALARFEGTLRQVI